MQTNPIVRSLLGLVLIGFLLGACNEARGANSGAQSITLYNGQHPQTTTALVNAFEKASFITVHERDDDEDVLAQQIVTEGTHSPADVIFTENTPALEYLDEKGLLAPLPKSTLDAVPAADRAPDGDFVGVSARVSAIVYNTKLIKASEVPTSVLSLADPKWKGKLAIAPGETDFQPIVTSIARRYGTAFALRWLAAVKANSIGHVYPDNETITERVNSGQATLGIINHYYWYRLRSEIGAAAMHSALSYLAPGDVGYVVDISGAAVLRSSHDRAAAERFVAFLVSRPGEEILAHSTSFEYPLGSGVVTTQPLRPFTSLRPTPLSITELGDGSAAVSLLEKAGLL